MSEMVRWIILACVVVVLTMAATFAVWYVPDTEVPPPVSFHRYEGLPPKLKLVGQPVYDFGTMPKKSDGSHSWEIQNVGEGELDLWVEQTSCSCTVAKLQSEKSGDETEKKRIRIPPGGSKSIEVTWETRNWIKFAQTATLGTNDLDHPVLNLSIRGRVLFPVEVEPSDTVAFTTISNEEISRASLTILSPDRAGLKVTKVTSSKPDLIIADVKPMTPEELKSRRVPSGYNVVVEVKPGMPLGSFREELVFQTDHPKQPELKVTVAGKVIGPISVVPQKLEMPSVASEKGASGDLTLIVRGEKETHFQVAHAPGKLQVAIAPDDRPGRKGRYHMRVTVPPGSPTGYLDDPIILRTDHPKVGELKIPVSIYISRSDSG
jgi:hypothetical protein